MQRSKDTTTMKMIISIFCTLSSFAFAGNGKIWTQGSFKKHCEEKLHGQIQTAKQQTPILLECFVNKKEIESAWFDSESFSMKGSLSRLRNSNGKLIKDQEYNFQGQLITTTFYFHTLDPKNEQSTNLLVYSERPTQEVLRGNIQWKDKHIVIANPDLVFINGKKSSLKEVEKQLSSGFELKMSPSERTALSYNFAVNLWSHLSDKQSTSIHGQQKKTGIQ